LREPKREYGRTANFEYEKKDKKFIINKKEVEIVRLIFETYVEKGPKIS